MNNLISQLKELLASVTLSSKEKAFMKANLLSYIEMKPMQQTAPAPRGTLVSFSLMPRLGSAVSVALVAILLITGVAVAAEGTLPGDPLYAVKVNVTERVLTIAAIGSEADAHVHAQLAERRLQEAEKLAVTGDLDKEKANQIAKRFRKHAANVNTHIRTIEATNNASAVEEVSSRVETSLQTHGKILESLSIGASDDIRDELQQLSNTVKEELVQISEPSKQIDQIAQENEELAQKLVVEKQHSALARLEEARTFLGEHRDLLGERTLTKMDGQIQEASDLMKEGEEQVEEHLFAQAFTSFRKAQSIAGEVLVVLQATKNLDIDVEVDGDNATSTDETTGDDTKDGGIEIDIDTGNGTSTGGTTSGTTTATTTVETDTDNAGTSTNTGNGAVETDSNNNDMSRKIREIRSLI